MRKIKTIEKKQATGSRGLECSEHASAQVESSENGALRRRRATVAIACEEVDEASGAAVTADELALVCDIRNGGGLEGV